MPFRLMEKSKKHGGWLDPQKFKTRSAAQKARRKIKNHRSRWVVVRDPRKN